MKMIDFTEILPVGEANAMPGGELIHRLGLSDSRELRKRLAEARKAGQLICSAPGGGYFLPETREELLRWVNTTRRRAASTFETLKYARLSLEIIDGQLDLKAIK